jgi:hypothetical protein
LDEEKMVWIGSLTTSKVPELKHIKKLAPHEYYQFLKLFGEPLVQELLSHQSFNYQIRIQEGREVLFGPIYHLSEKELGALQE